MEWEDPRGFGRGAPKAAVCGVAVHVCMCADQGAGVTPLCDAEFHAWGGLKPTPNVWAPCSRGRRDRDMTQGHRWASEAPVSLISQFASLLPPPAHIPPPALPAKWNIPLLFIGSPL